MATKNETIKLPTAAEMEAYNGVQNVLGQDIAAARDEYAHTAELESANAEARSDLSSNKDNTLTKRIRDMAIKAVKEGVSIPYASAMLYAAMSEVAPVGDDGKAKTGTAKAFTTAFKGWAALAQDEAQALAEGREAQDTNEVKATDAIAYIASPEVKALKEVRAAIAEAMKPHGKNLEVLKGILASIKAIPVPEKTEKLPQAARKAA